MSNVAALLSELNEWQGRISLNGAHRYKADGEFRAGVTTAIKTLDAPRLDDWKVRVQVEGTARAAYSNPPVENEPLDGYVARLRKLGAEEYEHERLSDAARIVGVDVHALIEHSIKELLGHPSDTPQVCEEALFRFAGWREWATSVGLRPLASEARVFNAEYDYCGTVDLLSWVGDKLAVLDFKPTDAIWPERRLQLAAYRKALESMGWPPLMGYINCLPRDGGDIQMIEVDPPGVELETSFDAFLHCLSLYRWQLQLGRQARKDKKVA
jgi:hypothetical protein